MVHGVDFGGVGELMLHHDTVSDIIQLHSVPQNQYATFQVSHLNHGTVITSTYVAAWIVVYQAASQFNCLEFVNPEVVPERGIEIYVKDRTQGPSCCLAAMGGTLLRFVLP
mgnify:CR=1 FL=1